MWTKRRSPPAVCRTWTSLLVIPDFGNVDLTQAAGRGLMVAVVIMAETLLAENTFAFRNDYKLNDRQEILACAAGNIAAAAVGCCPVNGSISRTSSMNSTVENLRRFPSLPGSPWL